MDLSCESQRNDNAYTLRRAHHHGRLFRVVAPEQVQPIGNKACPMVSSPIHVCRRRCVDCDKPHERYEHATYDKRLAGNERAVSQPTLLHTRRHDARRARKRRVLTGGGLRQGVRADDERQLPGEGEVEDASREHLQEAPSRAPR